MAQYDRNKGKPWTKSDVSQLERLAKENTPTRVIGLKLGRTENSIYSKASESGPVCVLCLSVAGPRGPCRW